MTPAEIDQVETIVNQIILGNHPLHIVEKPLQQAMSEGAMALFGEKYGEIVRTITIGEEEVISYELCGGTHVDETGDIGLFLITSEGSAAAGIRRIEAITGRAAYEMVQKRFRLLKQLTARLECSLDEIQPKVESLLSDVEHSHKEISRIRQQQAFEKFEKELETVTQIEGKSVLVCQIPNADGDSLRDMADRFKAKYDSGIVVLASVIDDRPIMITAVTDDLVKEGINAGDLARVAAQAMEGSGGGRPNLAQAGGKNPHKVLEALETARRWISDRLRS
jgi:alanyl-tRNA synthetase